VDALFFEIGLELSEGLLHRFGHGHGVAAHLPLDVQGYGVLTIEAGQRALFFDPVHDLGNFPQLDGTTLLVAHNDGFKILHLAGLGIHAHCHFAAALQQVARGHGPRVIAKAAHDLLDGDAHGFQLGGIHLHKNFALAFAHQGDAANAGNIFQAPL